MGGKMCEVEEGEGREEKRVGEKYV